MLLFEDDPIFKEGIRDFLAENGYSVVAVDNGSDGVREVLEGDSALILCDMRMPKVSGEVFSRAVERSAVFEESIVTVPLADRVT